MAADGNYDHSSIIMASVNLVMAIIAGITMVTTIQVLTIIMLISTIALNVKKFRKKDPE